LVQIGAVFSGIARNLGAAATNGPAAALIPRVAPLAKAGAPCHKPGETDEERKMTNAAGEEFLGFIGPEDGSGLERAGHLRDQPEELARLAALPEARFVAFSKGQVLMAPEGAGADPVTGLGLLSFGPDAPWHGFATGAPIFLGLVSDTPIFARDLRELAPEALPEGVELADLRWTMPRLCARSAELAATARGLIVWHQSHGFCAACGQPSQTTHGGWQRLCPGCGAVHFPRTDPVVIMRITRGESVLLARSPGWPEGMYSCPAGFMEPGETPAAAVRREVAEETGIKVGKVGFVAAQPWPFPASLMLGCAGVAESEAIRVDPAEIEAALWVPRARLARIFAGEDPEIRASRPGTVARWMLSRWLAGRDD